MRIPTAEELGGMLRKIRGKTYNNKTNEFYEGFVFGEENILALLTAIGLPEPDMSAEPLSVEEWENKGRTYFPQELQDEFNRIMNLSDEDFEKESNDTEHE